MRLLLVALLAAAASAEVFQFVGRNGGNSALYDVRGAVTVGSQQLTALKAATEYNGTFAIEKVGEGEYLAKFIRFDYYAYDRINRRIQDETFRDSVSEGSTQATHDSGILEKEMQKSIRFFMKAGLVTRFEANKQQPQWSLNIFRALLSLLQNPVQKPANLAVPFVGHRFENSITGNCRVRYEIPAQTEDLGVHGVFNMTKTTNYKQCHGRPVYLHLKDVHRGCAGVCDNHTPNNFLDQYEEEKTDYEMRPMPGCPVNRQFKDSLVTFETVTKYNVSAGFLDGVYSDSMDVLRLFGGKVQTFTRLQLRAKDGGQGHVKVEQPSNTQVYGSLQHRLPKEEQDEIDIPVFALMRVHKLGNEYPRHFGVHLDAVVDELHQIGLNQSKTHEGQPGFNTPTHLIELIQTMSGMTLQEIRKTMPDVVRQQHPTQLSVKEQIRRQIWLEILGKAGSKSAVKIAVELIKTRTLTSFETRRVLEDVAAFQSYPDTDMIEQVIGLCTQGHGLTPAGRASACVAAGKIISKACNSKVYQKSQKRERNRLVKAKYASGRRGDANHDGQDFEPESEEYETTMGHLAIKAELRCTPEKLEQYVRRLSDALRQAGDFKQIVALINGLAKVEKPEVLPELVEFVKGTAPNMQRAHEQGEDKDEAVEFLRRVAILSLRNIAAKYPKEVNPIVRVIFSNITESVQTRLVAFDVWMNSQPAQWEVEKVMQIANRDTSLELTHYVYTALKTAMHATEPCYQLLAQRIRAVWSQIRPFDLGNEFSHLRSTSYYNFVEDYGVRGIWKMMASNFTVLPAFTQAKIEQIHGPFAKSLAGVKLLVKGGDKIWQGLVGKDGLLTKISEALGGGQADDGHDQDAEQTLKDIVRGMDNRQRIGNATPKAVLFWKLLSGEAIVPIDKQYMQEITYDLLGTVTNVGKQGASGHFIRVFVSDKAYHVEPSVVGIPVIHSTLHPILISIRYNNIRFGYNNLEGHVGPRRLEISGTIQPTILSLRQSRVSLAEINAQTVPTVKVSDVKEFNTRVHFRFGYDLTESRAQFSVKPEFDRVLHTGLCTFIGHVPNPLINSHSNNNNNNINYSTCIKSMDEPIRHNLAMGGQTGMLLRFTGVSHWPWCGLGIVDSGDLLREGPLGAFIHRMNKNLKHYAMSLYLEADQQHPVNEWSGILDMDTNLGQLAKLSIGEQTEKVQHVKVQYQPRRNTGLDTELRQVIGKIDQLLQNTHGEIGATTMEKQLLAKLEGRYEGHARHTIKAAMRQLYNVGCTQQFYAMAVEHEQSRRGIEMFSNMSYPMQGSPFRYDPSYNSVDERMNATVTVKLRGFGQSHQQEQLYRMKFDAVKSDEQKQQSEYEWFEVRCLAEQKAGRTLTDACRKAILKANSLDRIDVLIEAENADPAAKTVAYRILDFVKYKFYPNMRTQLAGKQREHTEQHTNRVRISANATRIDPWSLRYNVDLELPEETVTLSQIPAPSALYPVHMQLSRRQQLEHSLFRGQTDKTCVLGDKYIRTFDNVTFDLDVRQTCEYLLTRHQAQGHQQPEFSVTFQLVRPDTFAKKVRIQLHNRLIEFFPFTTDEQRFEVALDGTRHQLSFAKPIVFLYGENQRRAIVDVFETAHPHHAAVITLFTESREFGVHFDGRAARIYIGQRYKGATNGLCGNNDNEQIHEFIGPRAGHREYRKANDFIASYGIGQQCRTPVPSTSDEQMLKLELEARLIREQEWQRREERRRKMQAAQESATGQREFKELDANWNEMMREHMFGQQISLEQHQHLLQQQQQLSTKKHSHGGHGDEDQEERQVLKTYVSNEKGRLCFSAKPVPACKPGYHKEGVLRTQRVEMVCFARNDESAMQAMREVRQGKVIDPLSLGQVKYEPLETTVRIPRCQRYD